MIPSRLSYALDKAYEKIYKYFNYVERLFAPVVSRIGIPIAVVTYSHNQIWARPDARRRAFTRCITSRNNHIIVRALIFALLCYLNLSEFLLCVGRLVSHIFTSAGTLICVISSPLTNSLFPGIFPLLINSALWLINGSFIMLATACTSSPFV